MKKTFLNILTAGAICFGMVSCDGINSLMEPDPVPAGIIDADGAIYDKNTAESAVAGLYQQFRGIAPNLIIAGDMMADNCKHVGTNISQYGQMSDHDLTAANSNASSMWNNIYFTAYHANYILEKIPELTDIPTADAERMMGVAKYLRAMAFFAGVNSFGDIPLVENNDYATNLTIARTDKATVMAKIEEDLLSALSTVNIPADVSGKDEVSTDAVKAALARFYLYDGNYAQAQSYADQLITGGNYSLASSVALTNDGGNAEAIFEMTYTTLDNPGTGWSSIHNIFVSRREVIPSDNIVLASQTDLGVVGDRFSNVASYNAALDQGNDNGYTVTLYDFVDWDNIVLFRLGEMYLIRAEALANQNDLDGATADINVLRARANATDTYVNPNSAAQVITDIIKERRWELAYEGHRWYDITRTNKADAIMAGETGWDATDWLYPIPDYEMTNNSSLTQNPGY